MLEDGKQRIRYFWEDVFNGGKIDEVDKLFTSDFVLHDLADNQLRTRDDLKNLIQGVRYETPSAQAVIQEQFSAEDDHVVTRFVLRVALPSNDASTGAAAQQSSDAPEERLLELNAISITRLAGEQLAETWLLWESLRGQQTLVFFWRWPPW